MPAFLKLAHYYVEILHKTFHNNDLGVNILTITDADGNPLFKFKELATGLGYKSTEDAIWRHIVDEDKIE